MKTILNTGNRRIESAYVTARSMEGKLEESGNKEIEKQRDKYINGKGNIQI